MINSEEYFEKYMQSKNNVMCNHPYGFKSHDLEYYKLFCTGSDHCYKSFILFDTKIGLYFNNDVYAIIIRKGKDRVVYYLQKCSVFAPASKAWDELVNYILCNIGKTNEPFRLSMLDKLIGNTDFYINQYMSFKVTFENINGFNFVCSSGSGWCNKN